MGRLLKFRDYIWEAVRTHQFNFVTLLIALMAAGFAGWSSLEAHKAREEAKEASTWANRSAERSASAAEKSNTLVRRTQQPLLVPNLVSIGKDRKIEIENISTTGPAFNISGDFKVDRIPVAYYGKNGVTSEKSQDRLLAHLKSLTPHLLTPVLAPTKRYVVEQPFQDVSHSFSFFVIEFQPVVIGVIEYDDLLDPDKDHRIPFCLPLTSKAHLESCDAINTLQFQSLAQ